MYKFSSIVYPVLFFYLFSWLIFYYSPFSNNVFVQFFKFIFFNVLFFEYSSLGVYKVFLIYKFFNKTFSVYCFSNIKFYQSSK